MAHQKWQGVIGAVEHGLGGLRPAVAALAQRRGHRRQSGSRMGWRCADVPTAAVVSRRLGGFTPWKRRLLGVPSWHRSVNAEGGGARWGRKKVWGAGETEMARARLAEGVL